MIDNIKLIIYEMQFYFIFIKYEVEFVYNRTILLFYYSLTIH